jgi:hypothetical protein
MKRANGSSGVRMMKAQGRAPLMTIAISLHRRAVLAQPVDATRRDASSNRSAT